MENKGYDHVVVKKLFGNGLTESFGKCIWFKEDLGGPTDLEIWSTFVYTKNEYFLMKLEIWKPMCHKLKIILQFIIDKISQTD